MPRLIASALVALLLIGCGTSNDVDPLLTESTAQGEAEVIEPVRGSPATGKARQGQAEAEAEPEQESSTTAAPTTAAPTTSTTAAPTTAAPTTAAPTTAAAVYYKNCTAARDAGAAPIRRGEPGYGTHLDRDGDGIACE